MRWVIAGVVIGFLLGGFPGLFVCMLIGLFAGIAAEHKKAQAEVRRAAAAEPIIWVQVRDE